MKEQISALFSLDVTSWKMNIYKYIQVNDLS